MATQIQILEIVELSKKENSKTPKRLELIISKISEQEAFKIKEVTNLDVVGFSRTIDNSGINHCFSKHGDAKEKLRGQIQIVDNDFLMIEQITKPENIIYTSKNKQGLDVILYEYVNGEMFTYVEEVRTKRKKLAFQSKENHLKNEVA